MQAHRGFHDRLPVPQASLHDLRLGDNVAVVAATKTQYVNLVAPDVEADKSFDDGKHDGIVGPHATINQGVAAVLQWPEIAWGCCRRETDGHHALEAICPVVAVMRRLEHEDLAVLSLERGHAQAHAGFAKQAVAKLVSQKALQRITVVKIPGNMLLVANPSLQAAESRVCEGRKDLASSGDVKVEKVGCCVSGTQAQGEDSTSRGACNKVEARRD